MKTFSRFITSLPLVLALIAPACSSGEIGESPGGDFDPNPCATVETWCAEGNAYDWTNDAGEQSCACMCDAHEDCGEAPTKSHCGVLLRESDAYPSGYESVFEGGFPRVCRTSETTVP